MREKECRKCELTGRNTLTESYLIFIAISISEFKYNNAHIFLIKNYSQSELKWESLNYGNYY